MYVSAICRGRAANCQMTPAMQQCKLNLYHFITLKRRNMDERRGDRMKGDHDHKVKPATHTIMTEIMRQ